MTGCSSFLIDAIRDLQIADIYHDNRRHGGDDTESDRFVIYNIKNEYLEALLLQALRAHEFFDEKGIETHSLGCIGYRYSYIRDGLAKSPNNGICLDYNKTINFRLWLAAILAPLFDEATFKANIYKESELERFTKSLEGKYTLRCESSSELSKSVWRGMGEGLTRRYQLKDARDGKTVLSENFYFYTYDGQIADEKIEGFVRASFRSFLYKEEQYGKSQSATPSN